jgi:predicted short-subunit dehydrogenase-like oxidoreductase (DUF2520 family)
MVEKPAITLIGPGRVGGAIGQLAWRVGYRIAALAGGSDPTHTAEVAETMGNPPILPMARAAAAGQLVLLTVRDLAIQPVCEQLAAAGGLDHKPMLAHCSGALDTSVLQAGSERGCPVATLHPLQTFPSAQAAIGRLPGTWWFLEGDPAVVEILRRLATDLGGQAITIAPEHKPLYHAAAVFSANYLITLLETAVGLLEHIGLSRDDARKALSPLARASVENFLERDLAGALTGPIARGDSETVARHLHHLAADQPELLDIYRAVGRRTAELAGQAELLPAEQASAIRRMLKQDRP